MESFIDINEAKFVHGRRSLKHKMKFLPIYFAVLNNNNFISDSRNWDDGCDVWRENIIIEQTEKQVIVTDLSRGEWLGQGWDRKLIIVKWYNVWLLQVRAGVSCY